MGVCWRKWRVKLQPEVKCGHIRSSYENTPALTQQFPQTTGREGSPGLIFSLPVKFAKGANIDDEQVSSSAAAVVFRVACAPITEPSRPLWHPESPFHKTSRSRVGVRESRVRMDLVWRVEQKRWWWWGFGNRSGIDLVDRCRFYQSTAEIWQETKAKQATNMYTCRLMAGHDHILYISCSI